MGEISGNFAFLNREAPRLARFGVLAERYFVDDAPAALIKLRQLAEFMAKDVAAQHTLLPKVEISFDDTLRALRTRNLLPREVSDIFYHLKRLGNAAAHEGHWLDRRGIERAENGAGCRNLVSSKLQRRTRLQGWPLRSPEPANGCQ